jgi:hypothetical protein
MRAIGAVRSAFRGSALSVVLALSALSTAVAVADTAEDIRDIRGPKTLPLWSWVLTAVVAGLIVASLYAAYTIRRRRHAAAPDLTLRELTLERLESAKPLMRPDTAREFGIATSEVIRLYIEKRFEVGATQRTTEEFLQALLRGSNEALVRHRPLLQNFLQQCDLVKFAGASLAASDLEALFASARSFVLETAAIA